MNKKLTLLIMFVIILFAGMFYFKQYQTLCTSETITMGTYDSIDRGICFGEYGLKNTTDKSIQIKRYKVRGSKEKYLDTSILKPGDILSIDKHEGVSYRYVKPDNTQNDIELELSKVE